MLLGSAASAGLLTAPAVAQPAGDPDWLADWSGYVDVRAAIANGETSWLKGGYGKSRYGGDQAGDAVGRIEVAEAAAIWRPRFSQNFGAVVHLQYEPGQDHAIDLIESYLSMKTDPDSLLRASGKIGVFYPQISLEHDDYGWSTYHTITPSAINTWIGEEIKVAGVEGTVRQELGPGDLSFTASAFEGDDTAGTLMAFRGWALHDQEATVFGSFPLPEKLPRRMSFFNFQDSYSKSMLEVDDRVGFYGQLRYDGPDGSSLSVFHYDNAGNRLAIDGKQWGWATSFTNFGASLSPTPSIQVLSQYLTGETKSGWGDPIPIYAEFSSYYVLGAWDLGAFEIAGRYDNFQVDDRTFVALDNENESGSAVTVAITRMLAEHLLGRMELMRIDSDRPQRADAGLDPKDQQTVFQSSLKYEF
ncbi:MAG TPA: hypothetical protein VG942_19430 [Hyphomonadaceae bacterium]|nr:hypothetical protein [Hyphomonadaceae bacterium]